MVSGSKLQCVVSTATSASHPPTLVCGVGDLQSPLPGTFALAFADSGVLMIKSSHAREPELVVKKTQPESTQPSFPAVTRAAKTFAVRPGVILLLGGSNVLCSVSSQAGTPTLTCGLAAGGSGTFVLGSYVGIISSRLALLTKLLAGDKFQRVVSEQQPAP